MISRWIPFIWRSRGNLAERITCKIPAAGRDQLSTQTKDALETGLRFEADFGSQGPENQ